MTTQLLTVSPAVVRADSRKISPADARPNPRANHDEAPRPNRPTPPERRPTKGDWRYVPTERPSRLPFVYAGIFSLGMHVLALFAFNEEVVEMAVVDDTPEIEVTFLEMPPIEELDEPEEVFDGNDAPEEIDPGQYVPMQADIPSINTDAAFVQKMDLASLMPKPDFDSAKVASIPPKISRTKVNPKDMKDLFNLADLDQVPTPLLQRPPTFPAQYKKTVPYAEVTVDFIVDKKGKVTWAKVTKTTHHGFEDAAILGVSRWQFKPGKKGGKAVNTRMRVPLIFRVAED